MFNLGKDVNLNVVLATCHSGAILCDTNEIVSTYYWNNSSIKESLIYAREGTGTDKSRAIKEFANSLSTANFKDIHNTGSQVFWNKVFENGVRSRESRDRGEYHIVKKGIFSYKGGIVKFGKPREGKH